RSSPGIGALVVVAGRLLVGRAQERLPPREPPGPPASLQAREAQGDLGGLLVERGGWRILAAARADHRPCEPMVRRDQVKHEVALLLGEVPDALIVLNAKKGSELVPVAVEQAVV